jgi:hypothetical protein
MLRKLAMVTCLAMVMSLPIPMWTATRAMLAIPSAHSPSGWSALVVAYLFSAILPLFYFALYRSEGTLRLPKRLRILSLVGVAAGGIVVATGLAQLVGSFGNSLTMTKMLLSDFVSLSCMLLLITFFREAKGTPGIDIPVSRLLAFMSTVAVLAGGLWFAFNLFGLVVALRNRASTDMITGTIRTLLEQVCLFTAPFIVFKMHRWRSCRRRS